jgi:hypothetical protein
MAIQFDNTNTGSATLRPATSGTLALTLPSADGTTGQALTTNGSGQLAFTTVGGGLTGFTAAIATAAPNTPTNVSSLTSSAVSADADVAFVTKGTGATLAQVPDNTTANGNKRGIYATDFQKARTAATQVASGSYASILGGENHTASNNHTAVVGGTTNTASGINSVVVGGSSNTAAAAGTNSVIVGGQSNGASGVNAIIAGGSTNTASGLRSTVAGGLNNTASGQDAAVIGGQSNTASTTNAVVVGGQSGNSSAASASILGGTTNTANGVAATVIGGGYSTTRSITGNVVIPASVIPISTGIGVSQTATLVLARQTTDATATVLTSNNQAAGTVNQVILPNNSAYFFRGSITSGVTGGGNSAMWSFEGGIKRGANAASTTLIQSVINPVAADAGASTWIVALSADTTNGGLAVTVTGQAATTIRWVCKIETTEMTF